MYAWVAWVTHLLVLGTLFELLQGAKTTIFGEISDNILHWWLSIQQQEGMLEKQTSISANADGPHDTA